MLSVVGSAALALVARFKTGGVIINEHTLTREQTRNHVDTLHRWFDFIHLNDLPERLRSINTRPFCLLTFDDGKRSNATVTAPELERLGVPALFFVVSGFLGGESPLWFDRFRLVQERLGTLPCGLSPHVVKQLPHDLLAERIERACAQHGLKADMNDENVAPMTWGQARDLHKRGFSIGAHGLTHAIMTRETRTDAFDNIARSIAQVSAEIGTPCTSFAFPNGNYTAELAKHAVHCGARFVMTTDPTWAGTHSQLWRLPRLQLFGCQDRGTLELKIAVGGLGCVLTNPDGTGRVYRTIDRLSRAGQTKYQTVGRGQSEVGQQAIVTTTVDKPMPRPGVMHIIDTLVAAGAERVAVNIVNHLPRDKYVPYLCTTRSDGPLDALVAPGVIRLRLQRKSRFDLGAVVRLRRFVRDNKIRVLHAHSSALFIARFATLGLNTEIIWHAHYGRHAAEDERAYRYRLAAFRIRGVMTVNRELADWCSRRLRVPSGSVWYVPNPVALDGGQIDAVPSLPGFKGTRIVCVANFRSEKDHLTLIRAMKRVVPEMPTAHLLLAGKCNDAAYLEAVQSEIAASGVENSISILGERHDIAAILPMCDIGVLSSVSEGLPMSLLEYGAAGLPAVATEVGQCPDVLDHGRAGVLVPPGSVDGLARGLVSLLRSPERRADLGERLRVRVNETFSPEKVMSQICQIYDTVLDNKKRHEGESRLPARPLSDDAVVSAHLQEH